MHLFSYAPIFQLIYSQTLRPFIAAICAQIAKTLELRPDQVNVKAKTAEKMGPVGQGQAIEARAVVLLHQI